MPRELHAKVAMNGPTIVFAVQVENTAVYTPTVDGTKQYQHSIIITLQCYQYLADQNHSPGATVPLQKTNPGRYASELRAKASFASTESTRPVGDTLGFPLWSESVALSPTAAATKYIRALV